VRALVDALGREAVLRDHSVLTIGAYLVCVADERDPCDGRGRVEGESLAEELVRRGGILQPGREVLEELGITPDQSPGASEPREKDDDEHD
jgi:hypothetical protein